MSGEQELNPSVQQFKAFVKEHPGIVQAVKNKEKTLQNFFEEWMILGTTHEQWSGYQTPQSQSVEAENVHNEEPNNQSHSFTQSTQSQTNASEKSASDTLGQLLSMFKRMNVQDLQNHLGQFSSLLANVQNVIQTFQRPSSNSSTSSSSDRSFSFRKD